MPFARNVHPLLDFLTGSKGDPVEEMQDALKSSHDQAGAVQWNDRHLRRPSPA